ncbi:MAG: glyoxalase/bleomycin resistance/extradiol dioxygenase family protein [Actinobacteria bacterium]|nr:glyoxalase/bleomycin resistance/extradiol dioxygenase family protein [Actinomycetota bacterium]
MARVQLALNVGDLDAAIEHYTRMFGVGPAKVRDGYANFAIANPPLKLVLIAGHGQPGTMNHVGVELESTDEVAAKIDDARAQGFDISVHESETCCFAVQDKVWINSGEVPWEWYTVLEDAPADTSLAATTINLRKKPLLMVEANGSVCGPDTCC